ncbi:hypothetical protein ACJ41O_015366 [Fusarium nematophilum]
MADNNPPCLSMPDRNDEDAGITDGYLDAPFDYEELDHAPATSHGTYLEGINEGLESLEEYQKGGYHPVHLGDCLSASGRYRVLHKLGHGGFGTVWLCQDTLKATYVALKVMIGDVSAEDLPDLALERLDRSIPGAEYIAIPLDHFSVEGPNGTHHCIVLPVLGPCVSPRLWIEMEKEPGPVLRDMARQATQALNFLHKSQIYFRPSNILVRLANLDHLSEAEILSLLGQPVTAQVRSESSESLPAFSPKYLVAPANISGLGNKYLTDQICVIDFGESFPFSSPPEDLGIPENYLPPEVLLEELNAVGPACDLWALGCTLFEIRMQLPLFYMIYEKEELLAEMVRYFGKLPQKWWEKWEERGDFLDEQGKWIRDDEELTLEVLLSKPRQIVRLGDNQKAGSRMSMETPEAEQKLIADLLYKLFRYEPSKRASIEEALQHEWLKM